MSLNKLQDYLKFAEQFAKLDEEQQDALHSVVGREAKVGPITATTALSSLLQMEAGMPSGAWRGDWRYQIGLPAWKARLKDIASWGEEQDMANQMDEGPGAPRHS